MSIAVNPEPESPVIGAMRSRLAALAARGGFMTPELSRLQANYRLGGWYPIFCLELAALRDGQDPFAAAKQAGWRCLLLDGDNAVASAKVQDTAQGWQAGSLVEGPLIAGLTQTLLQAAALKEVQVAEYSPALFTAPALSVAALWLRSGDGATDLLLAIPPLNNGLEPGVAYHRKDFAERLQSLVRDMAGDIEKA